MARAYFNEIQRFRQWWIWLIIVISIGTYAFAIISSFTSAEENKATDDIILIAISIIPVLLVVMFFSLRLVTRIRNDGVYVQFKPLQIKPKHIHPGDIKSFEIRRYRPLTEYGGWGIRAGGRKYGKAYNVSGNIGLQLYLSNGKKLLIGTQHPTRIQKAMESLVAEG
jgi:hypothetical protein